MIVQDDQGYLKTIQEEIAELQATIASCQARLATLLLNETAIKLRIGEKIDFAKAVEDFNVAWKAYKAVSATLYEAKDLFDSKMPNS